MSEPDPGVRPWPGRLEVFVGANGAGKSNLCRTLMLLSAAARGKFALMLPEEGGTPSVILTRRSAQSAPPEMRAGRATLQRARDARHCGAVPALPRSAALTRAASSLRSPSASTMNFMSCSIVC